MPRTSLVLPAALQHRLHTQARSEGKKVAELIRDMLDKALVAKEQARMKRMYRELSKLEGMCRNRKLKDASTTIDEVLYGENGAWRGSDE